MNISPYKSWVLVFLQFAVAALLLPGWQWRPDCIFCLVCYGAGTGLGLWAVAALRIGRFHVRPDVHPRGLFMEKGPYRRIRHPMYTSVLLVGLGLVFSPFAFYKIAVWLLLAGVLTAKAGYEERLLAAHFPEYEAYRQRTRRFIPFVW